MPQHPHDNPGKDLKDRLGLELIVALAARTSEMLSMPVLTCPINRCRRARACQRIAVKGSKLACVHTLPSEYTPCFTDYLGWAGMACADARDGEHGAMFRLLDLLPPDLRGHTVSVVRDCLAGDARALACLDETLALIAEKAPPVFEHPQEEAQATL
jgi:hypothetical protein